MSGITVHVHASKSRAALLPHSDVDAILCRSAIFLLKNGMDFLDPCIRVLCRWLIRPRRWRLWCYPHGKAAGRKSRACGSCASMAA